MNNILKSLLLTILTLINPLLFAQQAVQMADTMRAEGKIYVVVAILVTILLGLLFYVFVMDRKVTRLEKKVTERKR
jgi:uncharacterized integral membrane protein